MKVKIYSQNANDDLRAFKQLDKYLKDNYTDISYECNVNKQSIVSPFGKMARNQSVNLHTIDRQIVSITILHVQDTSKFLLDILKKIKFHVAKTTFNDDDNTLYVELIEKDDEYNYLKG